MKQVGEAIEKYQLTKLDGGKLDSSQIIYQLQLQINYFAATHNLAETSNYNTLQSGIRTLESNLKSKLRPDDHLMIEYYSQKIRETPHISEASRLLFDIYDILNLVRDNRLAEIKYSSLEGNTPGALTQYISEKIKDKDSAFILGIFGKVRSGKSYSGLRLATNIAKQTQKTFNIQDITYTHDELLQQKEKRRENKTLKGSIQILDEAGITADSQSWFEKDVKRVVNTLKTQGFDNTCTIIISPMITDIANRARGLFHAIMIPWKHWGERYLKLTDTSNINYNKETSSWKFDFLDTDPFTGKTYKDKLQAAYGEIHKIDTQLPPRPLTKKYDQKSHQYKIQIQQQQRQEIEKEKIKQNPAEYIQEKAQETAQQWNKLKKLTKKKRHTKIMNTYNCGRTLADRILQLAEEKAK